MKTDLDSLCNRIAREGDLDAATELFSNLASKRIRTKAANALLYQLTQQDVFTDHAYANMMHLATMSISHGADPNDTPFDYSIFENACTQGHLSLVKLLLSHGAATNPVPGPDGEVKAANPLMLAIGQGHEDVVEYLLAAGADMEALNVYGETAIFWTVTYGQHELRELLCSRGACINKVDNAHNTLLHIVFNNADDLSREGVCAALRALAQKGVDPNLGNSLHKTAWDMARDLDASMGAEWFTSAIALGMADKAAQEISSATPEVGHRAARRQL